MSSNSFLNQLRLMTYQAPYGADSNGAYFPTGSLGVNTVYPQFTLDVNGSINFESGLFYQGVPFISGATGPTGSIGLTGAGFVWRGDWVFGTEYFINDVVSYQGQSWIAIGNSPYYNPGYPGEMWELMVQKGTQGDVGPQGAPGSQGPTGPQGSTGPGVIASYMRGSRSSAQTLASNNTPIIFNQVDSVYSSDITLDVGTGYITLGPNRTFRLIAAVPDFVGTRPAFSWYNRTTSSAIGSLLAGYSPSDAAANGSMGGSAEAVLTTSASSVVVDFRILQGASTTVGGSIDFPTAGSYPWFDIEVIAGNAPITVGSTGPTGPSNSTTGNWTLAVGANTVSFTVEANNSYVMWVNGNIPNGIVLWNATVSISNANVPAVGTQYGWYYSAGNQLVLTSIPNQIVGTAGSISTATVATSTANTFTFGITNNSASNQTVSYGYTKI